MLEIDDKKDCCGCNACSVICPVQCIRMKEDQEGFWYPEIDVEKCTECGLCEQICPILHSGSSVTERLESPKVFAAWNRDKAVRLDSTSGGVFSALAEMMFESKGHAAGAVYTENHTVHHIVTNDRGKLDRLRSSKYLQSDSGSFYAEVRELLEAGERVLETVSC